MALGKVCFGCVQLDVAEVLFACELTCDGTVLRIKYTKIT